MPDIKVTAIGVFLPPVNQDLIGCCAIFEWKVDLWIDIIDPTFLHPFDTVSIQFPVSAQTTGI